MLNEAESAGLRALRERVACSLHPGALAACGVRRSKHPMRGIGGLEQGSGACEQPVKQDGREGDPHTGGMLSMQDHIDECLQARGYLERSGG